MDNRRTPFGMAGQSSFQQFQPIDPQMMQNQSYNMNQYNNGYNSQVQNTQESNIRSLMADYENVRADLNQLQIQGTPNRQNGSRRPYSRELDLMNLLMIGSLGNQQAKSGLEGMGRMLGPEHQGMQEPQQYMTPYIKPNYMPQQQQHQQFQSQEQFQYSNPYPYQNQEPYSFQNQDPYQNQSQQFYQQAQSPPSSQNYYQQQYQQTPSQQQDNRQNSQLLINGQMGVNVDQYNQTSSQNSNMGKQSDRIYSHIEKQNSILEELSKNMMLQRQSKGNKEKQELQNRIKELESLNGQAQNNDDKNYDLPSYIRPPRPKEHIQTPVSYPPFFLPQPSQQQPYGQPYGFNPSQYGQYPSQQLSASQQNKKEKIQMLLLLKKLNKKEDMQQNKNKKQINTGAELTEDDDDEDDEDSVVVEQKPREMRSRPIPKPQYYDPQDDQDKLTQLKRQRGMINLRVFFHAFSYIAWYQCWLRENIDKKKTSQLSDMTEWIPQFVQGTEEWITRVCKNVIQESVSTPKLNLQIVDINKTKMDKKEKVKNGITLMAMVKQIIDKVVDNSGEEDVSEEMIFFLGKVTNNREFIPNFYFSKFEIARLNYTYHGAIDQMNLAKQQMMVCMNIWIRVIIFRIMSKPWTLFQGMKVTDQMKMYPNKQINSNIKTICSVLYEIVMTFLRGQAAIQPNNQKLVPIDNQVKERKDLYLKIESFEATPDELKTVQAKQKAGSDEPVLFPLYAISDFAFLFDENRQWVNTMVALIEGWSEGLMKIIKDYQQEQNRDKLADNKQLRTQQTNNYKGKQSRVQVVSKKREVIYQQLNNDIQQLQTRILTENKKAQGQKQAFDEQQLLREKANLDRQRQKI